MFLQQRADKASRDRAEEASWTRYWAAGHEHSCPTSFDGFYGPRLQAFWERQCQSLRPGDSVLDLGCGSGALLRFIGSRFPPGQAPRLRGVDAAALPTTRYAYGMTSIVISDRTPFRSLPFEPGSVSFAASQFGIEYDNTDDAWAEVFRVLRPAARVAFVVHKQGSHLERLAADDLVIGRAALDHDIFGRALALLPYLQRARTESERAALRQDRAAEAARARYNAGCDALTALARLLRHGSYVDDVLGAVTRVLSDAGGADAAERLDALRQGVGDHLARIAALRDSALDAAGLEQVRQRLLTRGFTLADPAVIAEGDSEMGWIIEGQR